MGKKPVMVADKGEGRVGVKRTYLVVGKKESSDLTGTSI